MNDCSVRYIVYVDNGEYSMIKDMEFDDYKTATSYAESFNIPATIEETINNQIIYENKVQKDENKRRYGG